MGKRALIFPIMGCKVNTNRGCHSLVFNMCTLVFIGVVGSNPPEACPVVWVEDINSALTLWASINSIIGLATPPKLISVLLIKFLIAS
jgi:hypothetical protein